MSSRITLTRIQNTSQAANLNDNLNNAEDGDIECQLKSCFRFRVTKEDNGIESEKDAEPFVDESPTKKTEESGRLEEKAAEVIRHYG